MFKKYQKLWLALGIMALLSPIGLIATGTAFGEWGVDQLEEEAGFIPSGLARMADLWHHAPLPDYGISGFDASFLQSGLGYIVSAVVGAALIIIIMTLVGKLVRE